MITPNASRPELDSILDIVRLREIAELDLFAPELSQLLTDLTREACLALALPLGMVNIVLDEAQYIAAHYGVGGWIADAQGTPVEWAFCRFVVRDRADFVVEDSYTEDRIKDSPLVTEDGLRCYAGIPLITSGGQVIGSFCVAGKEARKFDETEMQILRTLAAEALRRIESRRMSKVLSR